MKPIAISSCLALAALSLYAGDPQTTTAAPPALAATLLSSPRTVGIGDSPLVRAAKATNRLNKKPGQVITNETLVHSGGHFTTTSAEAPQAASATSLTHPIVRPCHSRVHTVKAGIRSSAIAWEGQGTRPPSQGRRLPAKHALLLLPQLLSRKAPAQQRRGASSCPETTPPRLRLLVLPAARFRVRRHARSAASGSRRAARARSGRSRC